MKRRHRVVPAQATVEFFANTVGGGEKWWRVEVHTAPWWMPPRQAHYLLLAFTDTLAAIEGLRRFEEETAAPPQPLVH